MTPEQYKKELDRTIWSYTRISSFDECPYSFFKRYIERAPDEANAFAQWGTLMHSLIECNLMGRLEINELIPEYSRRFKSDITAEFPPGFRGDDMADNYFADGISFLMEYEGMPEDYEMLGCEIATPMEIEGFRFTGFIDLLVRDKKSGGLIVVDHKSKRAFKSKRERAQYARQLYLYSRWVHDEYGEYPQKLVFNLVRGEAPEVVPFNMEEYESALGWAVSTIRRIYAAKVFPTKLERQATMKKLNAQYAPADYFCVNICGMRKHCPALGTGSEDE